MANTHLDTAASGPGKLANHATKGKVDKYAECAAANDAVHLPFAVETMGGLSVSAQQLLREIHHAAASGRQWRDAQEIGTHLVSGIAISVQRCQGVALQASLRREVTMAVGQAA